MPTIIAGKRRGAKLLTLPTQGVRPTLGRCREAIFSSLHSMLGDWQDEVVLDAFAGSGALGLEAWSRGAAQVYFVEQDEKHFKVLQKNIENLSAQAQSSCFRETFPSVLERLELRLSLVFLDPPYASDLLDRSLMALAQGQVLIPNAVISLEYDAQRAPKIDEDTYTSLRLKKYGRVVSQILRFRG